MKTITIIGLGVIGASIAAAIKKYNHSLYVIGCDKNSASLETALQMKIIDEKEVDIKKAIRSADIIIIATSISVFQEVLVEIAKEINSNQIITDVCSVKSPLITLAKEVLKNHFSQFVPGHPLAGSEKNGISGANEELFHNKKVLLTPVEEVTSINATEKITTFWRSLKANVTMMDPDEHDTILALTSHLPHFLAFSYVNIFDGLLQADKSLEYTSGSFNDLARIGKSSAAIWADIFLANRENLKSAINHLEIRLSRLRMAIDNNDKNFIVDFIGRANAVLKENENE